MRRLPRCSRWSARRGVRPRSPSPRPLSPTMDGRPRPRRGDSFAMSIGKPRTLGANDLDRVAEIERDTFPDPWSKRSFAETIAREQVRSIAVDDAEGRLVGYA